MPFTTYARNVEGTTFFSPEIFKGRLLLLPLTCWNGKIVRMCKKTIRVITVLCICWLMTVYR